MKINRFGRAYRFWRHAGCGGGSGIAALTGGVFGNNAKPGKAAGKVRQQSEKAVQELMAGIDTAYAGYTPQFYQQAGDQYVAAQMPALSQEYKQARDQTQFGLANRGLERSSTGERLGDTLNRQFVNAKLGLADQGQAYSRALQQQVENYRNQQVGQLQTAINPSSAAIGFINQATQMPVPNASGAVTNSMGNFANQYLMANLYSRPDRINVMPDYTNSGTANAGSGYTKI